MVDLINLKEEIQHLADPERAKNARRYFKSGKGEYGEGDSFIGLTIPQVRVLAKTLCINDKNHAAVCYRKVPGRGKKKYLRGEV